MGHKIMYVYYSFEFDQYIILPARAPLNKVFSLEIGDYRLGAAVCVGRL